MISVILLTIMRDEGFGLNTLSYLSQLVLVIVRFLSIDDMDIINAANLVNPRGEDLINNIKM